MTDALRRLVAAMHATPTALVYEFAGAGAEALAWLHAVGGSSRTVLEATDRYVSASLADAIGSAPPQAVAPEVAVALARRARRRAAALVGSERSVVGVGCTATIATDRVKRGEHRAHVAVVGALGCHELSLVLAKGARDRDGEERLVSTLVVHAAAIGVGALHRRPLDLVEGDRFEERFVPAPALAALLDGRRDHLALTPAGDLCDALPWPSEGVAIVAGSFNPLHEGHVGLARAATAHLGRRAAFELATRNAEKPTIDALELYRRAAQFLGRAPLLLTGVALFSDKAALYPGSTFVIGVDTAARVLAARFYDGADALDASLDAVRRHGCRFLVAGRRRDATSPAGAPAIAAAPAGDDTREDFMTLDHLDVPARHADLFEALPEAAFRADVSSSALRERWVADGGVA